MVMARSLDKDTLGHGLLLSLPFSEGVGTATVKDIARPHHLVSQANSPAWTQLPSGQPVMSFNGVNEYLSATGASTADLDFVAGDFSIAMWAYIEDMSSAMILAGRYELDVSGWELYTFNYYLNLRISTGGADPSVSCYGKTYNPDTWMLLGLSRAGAYPRFWRDGREMEATYETGGIPNPTTSAQDLVIGVRYSKNANYLNGKLGGLRIWNRALEPYEHRRIYDEERHLYE